MTENKDIVEVYSFRGQKRERVPFSVRKLAVKHGVRELPSQLCYGDEHLQEASLPNELIYIGQYSFSRCVNLLEINPIPLTVKSIGMFAFSGCTRLKKVEFENDVNSRHQLQSVGYGAFSHCESLIRIKPPSSLITVGKCAFERCYSLKQVDLSNTCVAEIPHDTFSYCMLLQTVSFPHTVTRIGRGAFLMCNKLVTVAVPFDSQPITIASDAFFGCDCLANLELPEGSAEETTGWVGFPGALDVIAEFVGRFDDCLVNKLCYYQELREGFPDQPDETSLVDSFGMTPLHILFSVPEPRMELLEVLLEHCPYRILKRKDCNDMRSLDYLIDNWTDDSASLLERTLQSYRIDPVCRWGTAPWVESVQSKVGELLSVNDTQQRQTLLNEVDLAFGRYEKIAATSMLELALWKWTTIVLNIQEDGNGGNNGSDENNSNFSTCNTTLKKCHLMDPRELCRYKCGSDAVIPNVIAFL